MLEHSGPTEACPSLWSAVWAIYSAPPYPLLLFSMNPALGPLSLAGADGCQLSHCSLLGLLSGVMLSGDFPGLS